LALNIKNVNGNNMLLALNIKNVDMLLA